VIKRRVEMHTNRNTEVVVETLEREKSGYLSQPIMEYREHTHQIQHVKY